MTKNIIEKQKNKRTISEKDFHAIDLLYFMMFVAQRFLSADDLPEISAKRRRIRGVVIAEFINFIAGLKCIDLTLLASDLEEEVEGEYLDIRKLNEEDKKSTIDLLLEYSKIFPSIAPYYIAAHPCNIGELGGTVDIPEDIIIEVVQAFMSFFEDEFGKAP